ncbi:hypothetical protein P8452_55819 [Trifolium repens]|nr:hypothetical protein P8452_55819 [Trifolium repens]
MLVNQELREVGSPLFIVPAGNTRIPQWFEHKNRGYQAAFSILMMPKLSHICLYANLSGHHFNPRNGYEYQFTQEIVKYVSNKINRIPLHIADYPVEKNSGTNVLNKDEALELIWWNAFKGTA